MKPITHFFFGRLESQFKDQENFNSNLPCCLINLSESALGKVSKQKL